jgi:hypothetical protein
MALGTAIALFSTLAHALMIVLPLLLPETRGRTIASLDTDAPGAAPYLSQAAVGRVEASRLPLSPRLTSR